LNIIKKKIKNILKIIKERKINISWIKKEKNTNLFSIFPSTKLTPEISRYSKKIEKIAETTNGLGPQPLWDGYGKNNIAGKTRMPDGVRTNYNMGNLYSQIVKHLQPNVIVEFGTAFGVSSMYFLSGIQENSFGHLFTFEPNNQWRDIAVKNISEIGNQFTSISGTFEDNQKTTLPDGTCIDLAFVDAIHTSAFVRPQIEIVLSRSHTGTIIILDDINFSDDMQKCWIELANDERFIASASLGNRVGILEVK
jgi:predicted O-methyltransferase YrrM